MTRLLVIDTEDGGLDSSVHSILTLAGVVWDDGTILAEQEFFILEDPLVVTAKAMEINRIDIVEHAKIAVPPAEAMSEFRTFLRDWFDAELALGGRVPLVGHNVSFDIGFMHRLCKMTNVPYDELFSHRSLDTMSILRFLYLLGKVPETALSSEGGFNHFGITFAKGERHTALGDARATADLLTRMIELVRDGR